LCGALLDRPKFEIICGQTRTGLRAADLAMAASGTVTLEGFLLGCPLVVFYRLAPSTYWLARTCGWSRAGIVSLAQHSQNRANWFRNDCSKQPPQTAGADALAWLNDPARRTVTNGRRPNACGQQLAASAGDERRRGHSRATPA
jgi:lipid-A-disaccharide synthase